MQQRQVVEIVAEDSRRARDHAGLLANRNSRPDILALAVGHETHRLNRPGCGVELEPDGTIDRNKHFTPEQDKRLMLKLLLRNTKGESFTPAAFVDCQHQSGLFPRPSTSVIPQAKAAFVTLAIGMADLVELDRRIPHQRTVGEDPEVAVAAALQPTAPVGVALFAGSAPIRRESGFGCMGVDNAEVQFTEERLLPPV